MKFQDVSIKVCRRETTTPNYTWNLYTLLQVFYVIYHCFLLIAALYGEYR